MSSDMKWSSKCQAAKLLEAMVRDGEIGNDTRPKIVWESHPEFKKYKLAVFRNHLHKIKAKYGTSLVLHSDFNDDASVESGTEIPHMVTPAKKKFDSDVDNGDKYNFYMASPWTQPGTGKKFCDVFILLPSGLHDNDAYEVRIADCGTFLNMGITWPKALSAGLDLMASSNLFNLY